ncbi:hypothetical protein F5880DRAFT_737465 [Lentinula raphanica]|nr:hypothetical protein F5880DRAFT_737465 [Lentinula raphanica]
MGGGINVVGGSLFSLLLEDVSPAATPPSQIRSTMTVSPPPPPPPVPVPFPSSPPPPAVPSSSEGPETTCMS